MQVRDLMTADPITTGAEASVLEARQLMVDKRIRHLLITKGSRLLGMVTDRDIRLTLPSPATSLSIWEISYRLAGLNVRPPSSVREDVVTRPVDSSMGRRRSR